MEDAGIIELLFKRDEASLAALHDKYHKPCLSAAMQILNNVETAEECLNDMLLAVWNSIPPYVPYSLRAFAVKVIRRIAVSRLRKETSLKRGGGEFAAALDELEDVIGAGDPASEVELKELETAVQHFLNGLPGRERRTFVLRYWYLNAPGSIAEVQKRTVTAVTSELYRTRKKLKEYLFRKGLIS